MMKKEEHENFYNKLYEDHICKICERLCNGKRSLGNHLARSHKILIHDYVLKYIFKDQAPLCDCGCGDHVNWHKLKGCFNRYISGHNENDGLKNYKPTQEVIDHRNEAIRNSYAKNGIKISRKISKSVTESWTDEQKRNNIINGRLKLWKDPEYKSKMTKIRKKVWEEQYNDIYQKIFTDEFRQKISEANMKRDFNHTSKEEQMFINLLMEKVYPDNKLIASYWINKTNNGRKKCFDVYNKEKDLLIEYDGSYWHGLDRIKNFTSTQKKSILNDNVKNILSQTLGLSLIRISSKDAFKVCDEDSLIKYAYHYFDGEKLIKSDMVYRIISALEEYGCTFEIFSPLSLKIVHKNTILIIDFRTLSIQETVEQKYYHDRFLKFSNNGYKYLNIYSDEFYNKPHIVFSMILNKLHLIENTIYARNCEILTCESATTEKEFYNENHLMGLKQGTTKNFILKHNGVTVCSLSLKKTKNNKLEIIRFASLINTSIVGGFSRLLKHSIKWAKENNYDGIITYSDLAHGSGKVYEDNGFTFVLKKKSTMPYWYTNGSERFSRQMFMPKDGLTEKQLVENTGVTKVWGCGNYYYELNFDTK